MTALDPDPREDRLPRWAQDELRGLRSWLRQSLDALETRAHPGGTDTYVRRGHGLPDLELAPGERVRFRVGGSELEVHTESYSGGEPTHLSVSDQTHKSLVVHPWVTNVVHVAPHVR